MEPEIVMLIRHGEKPTSASDSADGITFAGRPAPASMTPLGWARAGALVCLFAPAEDAWLRPGLHRPASLFASNTSGPGGGSDREAESVRLLADRLGIAVNLDHGVGEEAALMAAVARAASPVLICWQHGHMTDIATALSPQPAAPPRWPPDRFDVVWVFRREADTAGYRFSQIPELLMPGDRPDPIS